MTTRHVLKSDGAWVELRDTDDLRSRDRRKINQLINDGIQVDLDQRGDADVRARADVVRRIMNDAPDAVAALLITAWEIPYLPDAPLPSLDIEVLGDLRLDDADRLAELIDPVVTLLMPGKSTNPDDHDKPGSPSEPASA